MEKGEIFKKKFLLNKKVYLGFVNTFSDRNPLHTNILFARKKGFKTKVMHGNILNGFLSYFIGECLPEKNVLIVSQEIAYHRPVYLGQWLTLIAEVIGVYESVHCIDIKYSFIRRPNINVAKGEIRIRRI